MGGCPTGVPGRGGVGGGGVGGGFEAIMLSRKRETSFLTPTLFYK